MVLRVDRARSTLLGVFLFLCFIIFFHSQTPPPPESQSPPPLPEAVAPPDTVDDGAILGNERTESNSNPLKIAIACMTTSESTYDYTSLSNKFLYAQKHDYHLEFDWIGDGFWHKLTMVDRLIEQGRYDWIWWIDFDTLITNTSVRLEDLIQESLANATDPDRIDMILTPDCFPLNAGAMLFRSTRYVRNFIADTFYCRTHPFAEDNDHPSEQDCMQHLISTSPHASDPEKDHALFIPQWKMNAFPEEIPCYDDDKRPWEPGMFVLHFAGAWAHMPNETDAKATLFEKYQGYVVGDDDDDGDGE